MGSVFSDLYAAGYSSRFVLSSYFSECTLHLKLSSFNVLGAYFIIVLESADAIKISKKNQKEMNKTTKKTQRKP